MSSTPDIYVGPAFLGWRSWRILPFERLGEPDSIRLCASGTRGLPKMWSPLEASRAVCGKFETTHEAPWPDCDCGFYAYRSRERAWEHLQTFVDSSNGEGALGWAFGQVSLWGRIVECEDGWRAQYAYPYSLTVYGPPELARQVRALYLIDVDPDEPLTAALPDDELVRLRNELAAAHDELAEASDEIEIHDHRHGTNGDQLLLDQLLLIDVQLTKMDISAAIRALEEARALKELREVDQVKLERLLDELPRLRERIATYLEPGRTPRREVRSLWEALTRDENGRFRDRDAELDFVERELFKLSVERGRSPVSTRDLVAAIMDRAGCPGHEPREADTSTLGSRLHDLAMQGRVVRLRLPSGRAFRWLPGRPAADSVPEGFVEDDPTLEHLDQDLALLAAIVAAGDGNAVTASAAVAKLPKTLKPAMSQSWSQAFVRCRRRGWADSIGDRQWKPTAFGLRVAKSGGPLPRWRSTKSLPELAEALRGAVAEQGEPVTAEALPVGARRRERRRDLGAGRIEPADEPV